MFLVKNIIEEFCVVDLRERRMVRLRREIVHNVVWLVFWGMFD